VVSSLAGTWGGSLNGSAIDRASFSMEVTVLRREVFERGVGGREGGGEWYAPRSTVMIAVGCGDGLL